MNLNKLSLQEFRAHLLRGACSLDVRSRGEFVQGHVPGAVNLPLLDDAERAAVGAVYKQHGAEAAVAIGHRLISGAVKDARVGAWRDFLGAHPEAVLYCFRGGLRSQISCQWLADIGVEVPRLDGGYKAARRLLMAETKRLSDQLPLLIVAGVSGGGKTQLLRAAKDFRPVLDLEDLAAHRGSVFGATAVNQPSQSVFENQVAVNLMRLETSEPPLLLEDESWTIGRCMVPSALFQRMAEAPMICIVEDLEARAQRILAEYVLASDLALGPDSPEAWAVFARFRESTQAISRRLGGVRTQEVLRDLETCEVEFKYKGALALADNLGWIRKLLAWYYDPFYERRLQKCADKIKFQGTYRECLEFLRFTSLTR